MTYSVEATERLEPNASWLPVGSGIVSGGDTTSFVDPALRVLTDTAFTDSFKATLTN
jgi:hypothetical protein